MNDFKISFIIPVYNVEKYLEQCVESILNQDYKNIEIILVDDGSPDNSPTICDRYAEKYESITVIHKENGGASDARNCGIEKATGYYILFVDADDYIEKNSLGEIVGIVCDNPVDIVFLEAQKVFNDGVKESLGDGITKDGVSGKDKAEVMKYLAACSKYPASPCTKLIKRDLFANGELLFVKGLLAEDLDWSIKLFLKAETFNYCPVMYYNYRQNISGSASNLVSNKKVGDMLSILEKWCEASKNMAEAEKQFVLSQMAYELPIIMLLHGKLGKEDRKLFKNRIKKLLFLFGYRDGLRYKGVGLLSRILGVELTCKIINIAYNNKL